MTVPPDPTSRRVAVPANGAPVVVNPDIDETLWREEVQDRFGNHATGITVALLLAVLALVLAGWQWLEDDDGTGSEPDSGRNGLLAERIRTLETAQGALATKEELTAYADQQQALDARVGELRRAVETPGVDVQSLQTAIDATQQSLDQLEGRVTALEQSP